MTVIPWIETVKNYGYFTTAISLGRHSFVKNGSSGL